MSLSAEKVALWSSNSLQAMTRSIEGSRERMRKLQREIERSERQRGLDFAHEMRVQDEFQQMELKALQQYHTGSLGDIHRGSDFIDTFHGSRPIETNFVNFCRQQDEVLKRHELQKAQSSQIQNQPVVRRLAADNQELANEIHQLKSFLAKQKDQFEFAAHLDAKVEYGTSRARSTNAQWSTAGNGNGDNDNSERESQHSLRRAKANPLQSELVSAYWNALNLVQMHDAAMMQSNSQEYRRLHDARRSMFRSSLERSAGPLAKEMKQRQLDLELSLVQLHRKERLAARNALQDEIDQARIDFCSNLTSRHELQIDQIYGRLTHGHDVAVTIQRLESRTRALAASLSEDVVGNAERAYKKAENFREGERFALDGIDFLRTDAEVQANVDSAICDALPADDPTAGLGERAEAHASLFDHIRAPFSAPGLSELGSQAYGDASTHHKGLQPSTEKIGVSLQASSPRRIDEIGDPSLDPVAAKAMAAVFEQMTAVAELREELASPTQ